VTKIKENKKSFWIEKFDCFSILGKDSKRFLNGITTGNIINLKNQIFKTCWLTPNGVLKSLLEINCLEENIEVLILEGNTKEIKKYFSDIIFPSDDVLISDTFSINRFQEVDEINSWKINQPVFFKNEDREYKLYKNHPNVMNANALKLWKLKQAIPSLNNEINGKNNPLELGLTDLIDFNKGCYLGQETMSKIKNVSSLRQELRVWSSKDNIFNIESYNKNIFTNSIKEESVGYITSFYSLDSQLTIGLAMVKKRYLKIGSSFYSENFGQIVIDKSVGSTFL
tara:strand:+ start:601 stop:1449 length:849 start_codon:yes stop_codon:yes gene_type:complete